MRCASRAWLVCVLGTLSFFSSGCTALEDMLRDNGMPWPLLVGPLLLMLVVSASAAFLLRTMRLESWDLANHADEPSARNVYVPHIAVGVLVGIGFVLYALTVPAVDPKQQVINATFW